MKTLIRQQYKTFNSSWLKGITGAIITHNVFHDSFQFIQFTFFLCLNAVSLSNSVDKSRGTHRRSIPARICVQTRVLYKKVSRERRIRSSKKGTFIGQCWCRGSSQIRLAFDVRSIHIRQYGDTSSELLL
jgi:hypothetical protein